MKKYLYLLLVSLGVAFACEKPEPTPKPVVGKVTPKTDEPIIISDEGGSKQIAFDATLDWTATSSESWLTVQPASGKAGQDISITLTAGANQNYDPRTAAVTIKSGEDSKEVQVTQKQKGALLLTDSTIPVGAEGKIVKIIAKANSNVSAAIDQAAKEWIIDISTRALIDYSFEFEVKPNAVESPRSGSIVFSNEAGSETVTIEQEGLKPANVTGQVTCNGTGVPDVLVSDGIQIVKTDSKGNYRMMSEKKWQNVFVIIPSGYEVPLDGVMPRHYKVLTEDAETPEVANFELVESTFSDFRLLVLGDMHLARRTNDLEQFSKVSKTISECMDEAAGKVFAITLGDHAWDMYWVSNNFNLTDYKDVINETFGAKNVPFFHTMGNHDNEMEEAGDLPKALTYINTIAPTYYSFNLGQVHFIVLDDMDFTGVEAGQENRSKYKKNFTEDQLNWLRADLSYVDKDKLIVVTAHEPMAVPDGLNWKEELDGADADKTEFLSIFNGYNVEMITGHTHSIFNRELSPTFHEHNYGAVCGTWWWSGYLTPGIHIGQEGSPGGIGVFDFNENTVTNQYYQAAGQSRDYQFRAYDMNKVKEFLTEDYAGGHSDWTKYYNYIQGFEENAIFVNVWDWDENWRVEISENGTPLDVTRVGGAYDPLHIAAFTGPRLRRSDAQGTSPSFQTRKWNHYFKAVASSADSPVTVKVTDRFGNVFKEDMTRPKAFSIAEYRNAADRTGLVAESFAASSSTLAFKWTQGDSDADDMTSPYKAALYRDANCTDLVASFDIPAESDCWSGNGTRFVFGGLTPSTTYWFQVEDTATGEKSTPISAATEAFTVVDPTTVADAAAGEVILAEDFGELGWNADMLANAAGFIPAHKTLDLLNGNYSTANGTFTKYDNTAGRIFGDARVTSDKRLFNWGFFGNSSVYAYAGYFRVGSSSSNARTHIVSPALSGIPEGQTATIDVTVTCAKYDNVDNNDHDVAVFVEDYYSLSRVLDPDQKENSSFSGSGGKFTGVTLSKGYPLGASVKKWTTKTVRIEGVTNANCLVFGSYTNIDTKNRFFLSDVKVQIVSLEGEAHTSKSIQDETSFMEFVNTVAGGEKALYAKLLQNINISAATAEAFASIEDYEGIFNGAGKTISGLTKPLFNDLKGTAKNLTLNSTLNITADQTDLGMLANIVSGSVIGCTSKGSVTFNVEGGVTEEHRIGGLIGKAATSGVTVTKCTNNATVTNQTASADGNSGELIIGGVVGCFWGTEFSISGCKNTGAVVNNAFWNKAVSVGGIIGQAGNSASASCNMTVSDCTNSGAISNSGNSDSGNYVGGIIAWIRFGTYSGNNNTGAISNSGVAPNNYIGGLFGYLDINAKFKDNTNSGTVTNTGDATSANVIGGILGYIGKGNQISDAGSSAKYKLTNSGDILNSGSAKNIFIGGLFGRNSSGYFNMTGTSSVYSTNSGDITDNSGSAKSNGGDLCIGGLAGYTTTGIKTQYFRNSGDIYVTGNKGGTCVNVGGIGGWIDNNAFNFNNCRNTGNVTIDCTTTASIWAAGIVGCPKDNTNVHYYWRSNATIDTHAASVGGENYTAGLAGATGTSKNTLTMYGHRLAGTVWGSKTTTGLFCCTRNAESTFSFQGGSSNPNMIAPGTVRKDNTHDDNINSIDDVTIGILAGGLGSSYDLANAGENLVVKEW